MRLMVGPAGSGKTSYVLDRLREALRAADDGVRLLVPTATLAQHLAHQLAREGLVLRTGAIQTLASFAAPWAGDPPQAPQAAFYLMVEEAVRRAGRSEFARVAQLPGFCPSLARTIEEFSAAGCTSRRLESALPDGGLAAAFLAVYQEVERLLDQRGLAMRATRLQRAAARIESEGLGGIHAVWLDGFHALPDPELDLIAALERHADVSLTLADSDLSGDLRGRLDAIGVTVERMTQLRPTPVRAVVRAPSVEREVEEIARRILEQSAAGRPFREMGIIVRPADPYVPLLRATLERFGIPARFYFEQPLDRHPVVRFLAGAVEAMLGGWDHGATLALLRLKPRFANSTSLDRLAFKVAGQIPNAGLGALKELAAESFAEKLIPLLDQFAELEEWRSFTLAPKDWAARLTGLRRLFRPGVEPAPGLAGHELAIQWRSQAAALDAFDEALQEAAAALDDREMSMETFWRAVAAVLRLKVLRLQDARRNVVHVLSAPEARQWVLPVVFVCGMVEKYFPQFPHQDPFFPESARRRLSRAGIRVRTAAEFEGDERALFESAISRATLLVTLTYPEFDQRGERTLPSLYLETLVQPSEPARAVRPQPRWPLEPGPLVPAIGAPELLDALLRKTGTFSPTSLESYLQCAFQYFGRQTLHLRPPPPRPEDRLDFMRQGNIVHEVLKMWWAEPRDIAALFDEVFERAVEEWSIPRGYHTERSRNAMLDALTAFAADTDWPRAAFKESRLEEEFTFTLAEGIDIKGKIDRLDETLDGRAYVIDYKYSNAANTKSKTTSPLLLQAPLYMLATERKFGMRPVGMFYIGLRGGVNREGWTSDDLIKGLPLAENWREEAIEKTLRAVAAIRGGRIEAAPADRSKCRFCECLDVCRVQLGEAEAEAEPEAGSA